MILEGVVTNVTKFGAFVDIGVHQDGLVHISELSNRFIKEPSEAVKAGQIVKVKVLSVDTVSKRIALSMKALMTPVQGGGGPRPPTAQRPAPPAKQPATRQRPKHTPPAEGPTQSSPTADDGRQASRPFHPLEGPLNRNLLLSRSEAERSAAPSRPQISPLRPFPVSR